MRRGPQGRGRLLGPHPTTHTSIGRARHGASGAAAEAVPAGLEGVLRTGANAGVWRKLDEWLRHRLRAIQLKQWKRPKTMYRELTAMGATPAVAKRVAGNSRCWWRNSDGLIKTVMTIAYFDRMGVPRLS